MTLHESRDAVMRLVSRRNGASAANNGRDIFYDEPHFRRMLDLEIRRTKISRRPSILILIDLSGLAPPLAGVMRNPLQDAFLSGFRETDIRGWYQQGSVIGIIFTELGSAGHDTREVIFGKTLAALNSRIGPDTVSQLYITFHSYPKDLENSIGCGRFSLEPHHSITGKTSADGRG